MKSRKMVQAVQICVVAAFAFLMMAGQAHASSSLSASYFSMSPKDPDVTIGEGNGGHSFVTTVGGGLGPDGLPILNATGQGILHDYNTTTDELEWWSTMDPNVTVLNNPVYPSTITLPFIDDNMYTDTTVLGANGDDASAFLTADFSGNFTLTGPTNVGFNVCSDDDEFVYISGGAFGAHGTMVVDNGGIHGKSCTTGNVNTGMLSGVAAGTYTLTVFYADREQTGAAFELSSQLNLIPVPSTVPEPSSLSLLVVGLAGMAWMLKSRHSAAR